MQTSVTWFVRQSALTDQFPRDGALDCLVIASVGRAYRSPVMGVVVSGHERGRYVPVASGGEGSVISGDTVAKIQGITVCSIVASIVSSL